MAELRKEIDALDRHLVEVLCLRLGYMERAAEIKDHRNKVRDEERIEDVVQKVVAHARKTGAQEEFVEMLYRQMIEWCISYELKIYDRLKPGKNATS